MTRGVVHSILEPTAEATARRLACAPRDAALIELRADGLRAGDVAGLVRRSGRPLIVTVRDVREGGAFDGSTEEQRAILGAALDAGCEFVDVAFEGPLQDFAIGSQATRTILSHHGAPCDDAALSALFDAMAGSKAARLKIVPFASRAPEVRAIRRLLARARQARRPLCSFATGAPGSFSRIVALSWGSWGTYGAAARGRETGDGQFTTREFLDIYRVLEQGESTQWFALCGSPVAASPSPALHAAGYRELQLDAVYVPIETADVADIASLEDDGVLALTGFGLTIPLKEQAAKRCVRLDPFAACGSVNTIVNSAAGWEGFNTDAPAALGLIRKHLDPLGRAVAVVGAGGTARAIGAALKDAGAVVTLFNRSAARGAETGRAIGVASLPLSSLPGASWELLVQATPLGRLGEEVLLRRHLNGRVVLDAAYGAEPTPLVKAARARGLAVVDGLEFVVAQACLQFARLTKRPAPETAMTAALEPWRTVASA